MHSTASSETQQQSSCHHRRWPFVNWIPPEGSGLKHAIIAYGITYVIVFCIAFFRYARSASSSMIITMVTSQFILNLFFVPDRTQFWSEFSSWTAIYGMIQIGTPFFVYIYAMYAATRLSCYLEF